MNLSNDNPVLFPYNLCTIWHVLLINTLVQVVLVHQHYTAV